MLFHMLTTPDEPSVRRPIDDGLIRRIAQGDMEALRVLYDSVHGAVYGFALSIVGNPHDAADVLQDTFLRVYTGAGAYTAHGKPLAWVFTITRHLATDRLRERARSQPLEAADLPAAAEDAVPETEQRLLLEALLGRLTAEQRQVLILHTVRGMKHREIAAVLELPLGTVLSLHHRGIKRLKTIVKEENLCDR